MTRKAFNQLQTYNREIPGLFVPNAVLDFSGGLEARVGTLTASWERFMPWRAIEGDEVAPREVLERDGRNAAQFVHVREKSPGILEGGVRCTGNTKCPAGSWW